MERVSPQDSQAWRPGLPANGRCGSRARHFCNVAAVVSWKRALAQRSGAKAAMLEADPLRSLLLDLCADPLPWAPHCEPHGTWDVWLMVPSSDTTSSYSVVPVAMRLLFPHAKTGNHTLCSWSSCFQASLESAGPENQ